MMYDVDAFYAIIYTENRRDKTLFDRITKSTVRWFGVSSTLNTNLLESIILEVILYE